MAFRKASRTLFTAAAAVALGLQMAPWSSLSAQDRAPATLGAQTQARPISAQRRAERRQQNNAPTPQPQPAVQPAPVPNYGQSDVQRELQKLYEQNGRAVPEMVDVRQSMGAPPQAQQPAVQQPQYQPQAQAQPQPQPQYQAPAQAQQPVYAQPVTQATPQPATPPAPKKKGLLSKLFGKEDNSGPTQPPVEPPYTPPKNTAVAAPPALVQQPMQAQPLAQPATGRPNYGFLFEDEPDQLEQVPSQPAQTVEAPALVQTPEPIPQLDPVQPLAPDLSNTGNDGFEAPLFVDAPAQTPAAGGGIPALDFSAPIQDPDHDQIELGTPAALSPDVPPVAAVPKKPADPFSDEALFPAEAPAAPAAPAAIAETPVLGELTPVTPEQDPVQPDPVSQEPAQEIVSNEPLAVEPTPPSAEEPAPEMDNPYSGLTLDTEPVSAPVEMKPAIELPAKPITGNLPPSNSLDNEFTPDLTPPPREAATATTDSSTSEPPLVVEETSDAPKLTPVPRSGTERTQAKLEMIAARKGLRGLKGFCPVALRDHRDLVDAQSQFRVIYNEKTYYLCSSEAVSEFHSDPAKYAPAARGADVIHLAITGEEQEGTLDHAVWYKGRLYLFSSAETMETFVAAPSSHATLD